MFAIGAERKFKLEDGNYFHKYTIEEPELKDKEVWVKIKSISVNPLDTKTRIKPLEKSPRILGYDAVGIIEKVGDKITDYKVGDTIFYTSHIQMDGTNQTHQVIDEAFIAHAPKTKSYNEIAALPLTSVTASEVLFEVFGISTNKASNTDKTLLIINGSGGVGSMATQIAKNYGLKVITTASREETVEWSKKMGADVVLNHKNDLANEFKKHDIENVDFIFCTFDTDMYYEKMIELVKPKGHIATIVAFKENQDLNLLKDKALTFTHESMFARALHMDDKYQYHRYLKEISELIDEDVYQTTLTEVMSGLTPENLFEAHKKLENHEVHGKLVIEVDTGKE